MESNNILKVAKQLNSLEQFALGVGWQRMVYGPSLEAFSEHDANRLVEIINAAIEVVLEPDIAALRFELKELL